MLGAVRTLAVYIDMTFLRRVEILLHIHKLGPHPSARRSNRVLGTIPSPLALLVLLCLVHPSGAFAATPDQDPALAGSRQRIEKLDYRMSGRLTRVEGA